MAEQKERFPYDDIIDLPHPVSKNRARMPMIDRAAQFSPFAALTGYEAAIRETARITEEQCCLDEDSKAELDRRLRVLTAQPSEKPEVVITYFHPDEKKAGGAYVTASSRIKRIDDVERVVCMTDGRNIRIEQIVNVESPYLEAVLDEGQL